MLDFGILGINARNLQYIKKFNPKKAIRLADNKWKTKRFLSARGIPVPETYDIIKDRKQLYAYDFTQLPVDDFIVKPVRGSRGRGIYRVKLGDILPEEGLLKQLSFFDKLFLGHSPTPDQYYKISGTYVDDGTFRRYLVDILDGKNSLTSKKDIIMLEEVLTPGSGFEQFCERGLADIRVIVFNLIPVAAMIRIPTEMSDGKANLDRGAVAMGVEVGSGKISSMYYKGKIYTKDFPETYASFAHQYLPYRDDILSYSSKIQYFANLGYLALDRVITASGPKLLEINARAGLKFQNVSVLPLKKRLHRIKDMHVTNPEKGVEIAKSLFSKHTTQLITTSKVLYLSQPAKLSLTQEKKDAETQHQSWDIILQVDLKKKYNYASSFLAKKLFADTVRSYTLKVPGSGIQWERFTFKEDEKLAKHTVILGRETVHEYYIKPMKKEALSFDFINPKHLHKSERDDLQILDKKLTKIGRVLNISKILKPINFLEELDTFVTYNGNYNPVFRYRRPSDEKLDELGKELETLQKKYFGSSGLESSFAVLFKEKIEELFVKLKLITAYKKQKYKKIQKYNEMLYGALDDDLLLLAKEKIFSQKQDVTLLGRVLRPWEVKQKIVQYLQSVDLDKRIKVRFDQDAYARIMVARGRNMVMKISPQAVFREHELRAIMAHEVDVHVKRHIAGEETGWNIFMSGTAGYIVDEEGLAVLNSEQYLPSGYEKQGMYYKYFFLEQAQQKDFSGTASLIKGLTGCTLIKAFRGALRIKKGLQYTSTIGEGAIYMKDKIYLDGYMKMKKWIGKGGDKETMMLGKVKYSDLGFIL